MVRFKRNPNHDAVEFERQLKGQEKGLSRKEAEDQASKWIKGQAALHNPDQIAGGNPTDITGMGDTRINSSLGSQWKNNVNEFDKKVRNSTAKMAEAEKKIIRLNVKLIYLK